MQLCIIPDLHNRIDIAERIIEKEGNSVDQFILLGDYFDNYFEGPKTVNKVATFLKSYCNDSRFKFLIGNHDLHYIIGHRSMRSSTWSQEKFDAINSIITEEDWSTFLWSYQVDSWLFSHAGILMSDYSEKKLDDQLNSHLEEILENDLDHSEYFSPYGAFWAKYLGDTPYATVDGKPLNQMCGHSVLANWNLKQLIGYRVYYIDTCSQHYGMIDTKENTVNIMKSGYTHQYHPGEIKWLDKINQIRNL